MMPSTDRCPPFRTVGQVLRCGSSASLHEILKYDRKATRAVGLGALSDNVRAPGYNRTA